MVRGFDRRFNDSTIAYQPTRQALFPPRVVDIMCTARLDARSHGVAIVRSLLGLHDIISMSYVDGLRDGRGWAFREKTGPDPIHGFTLLREAYELTAPGYAGDISVPVLWDRLANRIVSNEADLIVRDLAIGFSDMVEPAHHLYPLHSRMPIDAFDDRVAQLDRSIVRTFYQGRGQDEVESQLGELDRLLRGRRYLLGNTPTLADVRLWVSLVRYDLGLNANGAAGPPLSKFARLSAYARDLYRLSAFKDTTEFAAFAAPLTKITGWDTPIYRDS